MRPVATARSNMVYLGPEPEIADLHCERMERGVIASVWDPDPAERAAIANGANVKLFIWGEPIPPVMLTVVDEPGTTEDAPEIRARLRELVSAGNPA